MTIGERIKKIADSKKISGRKLAVLAKVSKTTVNEIINNKTTNPEAETIRNIAKALGVPPGLLLEDNDFMDNAARTIESVAEFKGLDHLTNEEKVDMIKDLVSAEPELYQIAMGLVDMNKYIGPLTDDEMTVVKSFLEVYRKKRSE